MQKIFNEVFTIVGMLERWNITHHVEWIGKILHILSGFLNEQLSNVATIHQHQNNFWRISKLGLMCKSLVLNYFCYLHFQESIILWGIIAYYSDIIRLYSTHKLNDVSNSLTWSYFFSTYFINLTIKSITIFIILIIYSLVYQKDIKNSLLKY